MTVLRVSMLALLGLDETALVVDSAEAWAGLHPAPPGADQPPAGPPPARAILSPAPASGAAGPGPGGSWPGAPGSPRRAGEVVYHVEEVAQLLEDVSPASPAGPEEGVAAAWERADEGFRRYARLLHQVKRTFDGWILPVPVGADGRRCSEIDPPRRGGRPGWCAAGLRPATREGRRRR